MEGSSQSDAGFRHRGVSESVIKSSIHSRLLLSVVQFYMQIFGIRSYEVGRSVIGVGIVLTLAMSSFSSTQLWRLILMKYKPMLGELHSVSHHCTCLKNTLHFFHSEHTSLPDYKRSGGQCRTDGIFSLHRQWTQKGQFPPLASGEIHFHPLTYTLDQRQDQREKSLLEAGPLEINVFY